MSIRAKTRTRLLIFCLAVVCVVAVGAGGIVALKMRNQARLEANREQGLIAFAAGDHHATLTELGRYLRRHEAGDDPQVTMRFVEARLAIPEPDRSHWRVVEPMLRELIAQAPDSEYIPQAKEHLLEAYANLGMRPEAESLAQELIAGAAEPKSRWVRVLFEAQIGDESKTLEALATGKRYVEMEPTDLDGHQLYFHALRRANQTVTLEDGTRLSPAEQMMRHAQQLLAERRDDPRFKLLVAMAHLQERTESGNEEAKVIARELVDQPFPDAAYAQVYARLLDSLHLITESDQIWVRAARQFEDRTLNRVAVRRLWQAGQSSQVLEMTENVSLDSEMVPADVLALRALSLAHLDRRDEAREIISALAAREKDQYGNSWSTVLDAIIGSDQPPQAIDLAKLCETAAGQWPGEPIFLHYQAGAQAQLREWVLAAQHWIKIADQLAPSWRLAYQRAANALNQAGQHRDAYVVVLKARQRGVATIDMLVEEAIAVYAMRERGDVTDEVTEQLLKNVTRVQELSPGEARTLPIYITLLAETGRKAEAAAAMRAAIDNQSITLDRRTYLTLIALNDQLELGLGDAVETAYEQQGGAVVDLVFQHALELHQQGRTADGLALIDEAIRKADASNPSVMLPLEMAHVQYLTAVGDPAALDGWRRVLEKYPQSLGVLRAAVFSPLVRSDRELAMQAVNALRRSAGEEAITWRVGLAMVLVEHGGTEQELREAIGYLRATMDAKRTTPDVLAQLGLLYEKAGDLSSALDVMQQAYRARPDAQMLLFHVGRYQRALGLFEQATPVLTHVAGSTLPVAVRQMAASMLAEMGARDAAIKAMEAIHENLATDPPADRQLAILYFQTQRIDDALRICDKLMMTDDASNLRVAADLFAMTGRAQKAQAAIERLKALPLESGHFEFLMAEHYLRVGDTGKAMSQAIAATQADPKNWGAWLLRLGFIVRMAGELEPDAAVAEFESTLAKASEALPTHARIKYVADRRDQITRALPIAFIRPLLVTLIEDISNRQIAAASLEELVKVIDDWSQVTAAISSLRGLINRHPQFLPARTALINLLARNGQTDEAVNTALEASNAFPTEVEPVAIAANLLESQGKWDEAIAAGNTWRQRTMANPMSADVFLARAYLGANRPVDALRHLRPYVREDDGQIDTTEDVLNLTMTALIRAGRADEARALLEPHLSRSSLVRHGWIYATTHILRDDQTSLAWLEHIEPLVPQDSETERMRLGQAWWRLGQRANNVDYAARGKQILIATANRAEASELPARELALIAEYEGDLAEAETWYRRVLEDRPNDFASMNNLAMVLLRSEGDLAEAHRLIARALELRPSVAAFWDTRALVERAQGQYEQAAASIKQAIVLEPDNPEWQIALVETHLEAGDTEAARQSLGELELLLRDLPPLAQALRTRVEEARARVLE